MVLLYSMCMYARECMHVYAVVCPIRVIFCVQEYGPIIPS